MTIKMKELLKKLLNGEDVPKKIKYENTIYTYFEDNEYLSTKYREDEYNNYFDSGYNIKGSYITMLRNMLKKLHLKEYYNYDKWEHKLGV